MTTEEEIYELTEEIQRMAEDIEEVIEAGEVADLDDLKEKLTKIRDDFPIACCLQ